MTIKGVNTSVYSIYYLDKAPNNENPREAGLMLKSAVSFGGVALWRQQVYQLEGFDYWCSPIPTH